MQLKCFDVLLTMMKKRKRRRYDHISKSSGMAQTILHGIVKERKTKEEMVRLGRDCVWRFPKGCGRSGKVKRYSCNVICPSPTTFKAKGLRREEKRYPTNMSLVLS